MRAALAAALGALVLTAGCGQPGAVRGDLALMADRVFDGARLIERGVVVVTGTRVVWVGRQDGRTFDAIRTVRLGDATILPGFVDLHVHRLGPGLDTGVTTVRDVGAPEATLASSAPEPDPGHQRVLVSGPMITVPGGYPIPIWGRGIGEPVRTVDEARSAVARLARGGADVIKVSLEHRLPRLSPALLRATVEEAHERGLRVTAHVTHARVAREALAAGVDELAHMPCVVAAPDLMRELAGADVEIVGTLHVDLGCTALLANARAFVAAGGELLYGSDFGSEPEVPNGVDVDELELMVAVGMTPEGALEAATARAGSVTGVAGLGTLEKGSPADIVAFAGDAVADLDVLRERPLLVLTEGASAPGVPLPAG